MIRVQCTQNKSYSALDITKTRIRVGIEPIQTRLSGFFLVYRIYGPDQYSTIAFRADAIELSRPSKLFGHRQLHIIRWIIAKHSKTNNQKSIKRKFVLYKYLQDIPSSYNFMALYFQKYLHRVFNKAHQNYKWHMITEKFLRNFLFSKIKAVIFENDRRAILSLIFKISRRVFGNIVPNIFLWVLLQIRQKYTYKHKKSQVIFCKAVIKD